MEAPPTEEEAVPAESIDGSELKIPYRNESPSEESPPGPSTEEPSREVVPEAIQTAAPVPEPSTEPVLEAGGPHSEVPTAGPTLSVTPASESPVVAPVLELRENPAQSTPEVMPAVEPPSLLPVPSISPTADVAPALEISAAPPPLPEADREAAMGSLTRHRPGTKCFLCGAEMQGTFCPTCRMDWNE